MTATATAWKLPDLDTTYHLEDREPMTLGQMLDGIDEDLIPSDQTMLEDLLWAFGAWEDLEEMNAAFPTRATRPACCHDASDPQLPALAWRVRTARRQSSLIALRLRTCSKPRQMTYRYGRFHLPITADPSCICFSLLIVCLYRQLEGMLGPLDDGATFVSTASSRMVAMRFLLMRT